jgi:uncharacterized protein YjbJ (UPF0337 family)
MPERRGNAAIQTKGGCRNYSEELDSNFWRFPDEQRACKRKSRRGQGKVKETVGHATDDPETEAAGLKDQAKGKVKQAEGDVKEALHKPHKA